MEERTYTAPVEPYNLLTDYADETTQFRALNTYITTYIMYLAARDAFKDWYDEDDVVKDMVVVCENIYDSLQLFITFIDTSLNHIENYLREEEGEVSKTKMLSRIVHIRKDVIEATRDKLSNRNVMLTKVIAPLAMAALKAIREPDSEREDNR